MKQKTTSTAPQSNKFKQPTFAAQVKEELLKHQWSEQEQKALLAAFVRNSLDLDTESTNVIRLRSQHLGVMRGLLQIARSIIPIDISVSRVSERLVNGRPYYELTMTGNIPQLISDFEIMSVPHFLVKNRESKRSFLAGTFLAGGSINAPVSSNYHVEFQLRRQSDAVLVKKLLRHFKIIADIRKRKNRYVVYCKRSESISDVLKVMGAMKAMFLYEDVRMERDLSNQLTKLNNIDIANERKVIATGQRHYELISRSEAKIKTMALPVGVRKYCELRLLNPESSLAELIKKIGAAGIVTSKASISRGMQALERRLSNSAHSQASS